MKLKKIRFDQDTWGRLEARSRETGAPINELVRRAVLEYLERNRVPPGDPTAP
jgi:hypothetical protein